MFQRAYRHDLRCPHCGANWMPQYGASGGNKLNAVVTASIATPRRATATTIRSRSRAKPCGYSQHVLA